MLCPNCQRPLLRVENKLGTYWACPKCRGRAVSVPLLRRALKREYVNRLWGETRDGQGTAGRACPACERPMLEVTVSAADDPLKLDVCKTCEFVWFDPTEYEASPSIPLLPKPPAPTPKEVEIHAKLAVEEFRRQVERERDESPDARWKTLPALFGLPVEFGTTPLRHFPWLTWSLGAIIALVSLAAFTDLKEAIQGFGLIPNQAWRSGGVTFLTSFFLHGGWWHLFSNLYFLLIFGDRVEDDLGWRRYLVLVTLSTLAGDALHIFGEPHSDMPCIGASGGISGIIAYYAFKFPHAKLGFLFRYVWMFGYFRWLRFPAWAAFALWIVFQLLGAALQLSGYGGVSSLAHLGGAAVGLVCWLVWHKLPSQQTPETAADR